MRTRTKRVLRKVLSMALFAMMLVGGASATSMNVCAAEVTHSENAEKDILRAELIEVVEVDNGNINARTMLTNCMINVSCSEAGMHIEIITGTMGMASVIGVKDIVIQQKVWYGWKTIATGSGGEDTDCTLMGLTINYPNVEVGETYRITCVHYGTVDTYSEVQNDTGAFVFTY